GWSAARNRPAPVRWTAGLVPATPRWTVSFLALLSTARTRTTSPPRRSSMPADKDVTLFAPAAKVKPKHGAFLDSVQWVVGSHHAMRRSPEESPARMAY